MLAGPTIAHADEPAPVSRLESIDKGAAPYWNVGVYSAAMDKTIPLQVYRAASPSAPVLYLLNGVDGGVTDAGWSGTTDVANFVRDKDVTVVIPIGGNGSYYTDWRADDPVLGRNKWATFLTAELPPIVDAALGGNGRNAIAGISMAGASVLQLAAAAPGLYRAAASYSGCARTSDPMGQALVRLVVDMKAHGNADNMWGPSSDPAWLEHDTYEHADRLRGLALYLSTGSGVPGPLDVPSAPGINGDPELYAQQMTVGALIEAVMQNCTIQLRDKLNSLDIPATYKFRSGTHTWAYWQEDLHDSWTTTLAPALGL